VRNTGKQLGKVEIGNGWSKLREIKTNFIRAGQEKTQV